MLDDCVPDVHCAGTFEPEQMSDDTVYGITDQLHSWNPLYVQVCCVVH